VTISDFMAVCRHARIVLTMQKRTGIGIKKWRKECRHRFFLPAPTDVDEKTASSISVGVIFIETLL